MVSKAFLEIVEGITYIGDQIDLWRSDESARKINEPKAFKTEADTRANALIKKLIFSIDSSAFIVSEEDESTYIKRPEEYWLIDPIDGTASWYEGFSGFVTQVAYVKKGVPCFGVIYAPALKKIWWAVKGEGAFLNGTKMRNKEKSEYSLNLKLVDNYPEPRNIAKDVFSLASVVDYIESGSLGLKCVLVADGSADIFVKDVVVRDWDLAPAFVILSEVGAFMSDLKGNDIPFYGCSDKTDGLLVTANVTVKNLIIDLVKKKEINE